MASDIFLKLDGVEGESTDDKHKGEIEILSYSWGVSQAATTGGAGGGGRGKAVFQDFSFASRLQKSSPSLFLKCATGEHIKSGLLTVRKAGGDGANAEFYKMTLSDILVTAFQQAGADGDDGPTESISLNFQKVRMEYFLLNSDGQQGGTFTAEFDIRGNKAG